MLVTDYISLIQSSWLTDKKAYIIIRAVFFNNIMLKLI